MRVLIWRVVWGLCFRIWVPRFVIAGQVPDEPVIFAANHNSHADTATIQLALARRGHSRVLVAGAEDYFFGNAASSLLFRLIGVFPFPRSGRDGIARSVRLLRSGTSVILYPEGTRDGGVFRPGVAHLAAEGFQVVPVTISGTNQLLPKGRSWPRRSEVSLRFGEPLQLRPNETPKEFAARLERCVRDAPELSAAA